MPGGGGTAVRISRSGPSNRKFRRRFRHVEEGLRARGRSPAEASLEEMDAPWDEAKARERAAREDR